MEERILAGLKYVVGNNNYAGYRVKLLTLKDHVIGTNRGEIEDFMTELHRLASADVFDLDSDAHIKLRNPL